MKKILLSSAILFMGIISINAQGEFKFGAGVNVGVPVGTAADISSFTVGGEVQGEYKFSEKASAIGTAGYSHFIGKDILGIKLSYGAVPILAGARIYPAEQFFIGGQIGYGFFTGDVSGSGFAYKPQVGYSTSNVQVALSYNAISNGGTYSWVALSGVFTFGGEGSARK